MAEAKLTAQQLADQKAAKLMRQYRDLFGVEPEPGKPDLRSEAQITVWEDLKIAGYFNHPVFVTDKAGTLCPMRAAIADGRRSLFLYIRSNVLFAPEVQQTQQK